MPVRRSSCGKPSLTPGLRCRARTGARAGAIQVLGTPTSGVWFTSLDDDSVGGHNDPPVFTGPLPGDWGGIVFRSDSDYNGPRVAGSSKVFLNTVNHAK